MSAWGKVYGDLWRHEKWVGLSKGARALWVSAFSWSKESRTYGLVPGHLLYIFDGEQSEADELVESGLWERDGKAYRFHDWDERQDTLERDREVSEKRAAAGRKSGQVRRSGAKARTNGNKPGTSVEQTGTPPAETTPAGTSPDTPETDPDGLFPLVQDETTNKTELERERERERDVPTTRASRAFVYPDAFEQWWKAYPRKQDKKAALTSWKTATRSVPNETLVAAAEAYRDDRNREDAYTKLPATWLNGHCWENGPLPPRGGPSGRPRAGDTHRAMKRSHSAAEKYRELEDSGYYDQQAPQLVRRTA